MREIVLDTETTGLSPQNGDRVVEIGCVELINHIATGKTYQTYLNPQKPMEPSAEEVHGLSNEFLRNQPLFEEIFRDFLDFISDSPLVIHNADFDIGFLNSELKKVSQIELKIDNAIDTLKIARQKFPGAQNSLDALCRRFNITNYDRKYHGALLDSQMLADVYLELLGGKEPNLNLDSIDITKGPDLGPFQTANVGSIKILSYGVSEKEQKHHSKFIENLGNKPIWSQTGKTQ